MADWTHDITAAARKVAAEIVGHYADTPDRAATIRRGGADDGFEVQSIADAIIEERKRCARVAAAFFSQPQLMRPVISLEQMDPDTQKVCKAVAAAIAREIEFGLLELE